MPQATHADHYEVIVLGLGGMGSAAAWQLATRGLRVLGLEQFWPGHDRGSSHGQSRIIRQAYFEHPAYVPLLRRAYELFDQLGRQAGRELLTVTGALMIGGSESALVTGARESAQRWRIPHELLGPGQARRRFPTLRLRDDEVAVFEPGAGFVLPEQTVLAQLDAARAAGADLRFDTRVEDWDADAAAVHVRTGADQTFSADRLVVCAGAWTPALVDELPPLAVERQVMHWFRPGDVEPFRAGRHPVYAWQEADGDLGYGFPALPGQDTVKAAFFRRPDPADPDQLRREVQEAEVAEITAALHARLPGAGDHERAQACMYTLSPDRHFLIGQHAQAGRVTVAGGFSGHGFKFAPVVGEILAELVTEGGSRHDIALFDPRRAMRA